MNTEEKKDFEVIFDEEVTQKYMVKQESTGWFYPNLSKLEANTLCDKLNETEKKEVPQHRIITIPYNDFLNLHEDFVEWDERISWLDATSRRLTEISNEYNEKSPKILQEAIENGFDFKAVYGGNTEKTRRQYVDDSLHDLLSEKAELKHLQADDLRRIEFLKKLISMKIKIIDKDEGVKL